MWFRKASARRQAIREDVAEAESLERVAAPRTGPLVAIALVFFGIAALLQFWPGEIVPFHVGQVARANIVAPVSFSVSEEGDAEVQRVRETSPPVLRAQSAAFDQMHNQLVALKEDVQGYAQVADLPAAVQARFPKLTQAALMQLQSADATGYGQQVRSLVYQVLPHFAMVTAADRDKIQEKRSDRVELFGLAGTAGMQAAAGGAGGLPEVGLDHVLVLGQVTPEQRANLSVAVANEMPLRLAPVVVGYLVNRTEPTFAYDGALTAKLANERAAEARNEVTQFQAGQVLVEKGERITAERYAILLRGQQAATSMGSGRLAWWMSRFGRVLVVLMVTAAGALYVSRLNPAARTVRRAWAVCGLALAMLIVARAAVGYWPQSAYISGFVPTLLTTIILAIVYNQRFALGMGALHGMLVAVTLSEGLVFYIPLLAGVAIFAFGLREVRTRGKLIELGFWAGAGVFCAIAAVGLMQQMATLWSMWPSSADAATISQHAITGVVAGLMAAIVALAALPSIERLFRITTAMTLLELCDANKPLLRRLSQEAPGTFNHSLTVGIMAEAAGNAIGANGLLCRVGAYYHDVGKLSKPLYFIENQRSGGPNRHDKLSPAMSLLIIVGHVKDGVELAREYALPWVVHEFIEQHHGTTLVEYFFHAARKKAEQAEGGVVVSDTEFRYPGPKPQTREAAIVMICDGCESAVRAIDEPTAGRIESTVHAMIMKRLMDGQFGECDLTLRDLSVIEETLTRSLAAIHHGRVAYPSSTSTAGGPGLSAATPA